VPGAGPDAKTATLIPPRFCKTVPSFAPGRRPPIAKQVSYLPERRLSNRQASQGF
jgi:hypothetical protein